MITPRVHNFLKTFNRLVSSSKKKIPTVKQLSRDDVDYLQNPSEEYVDAFMKWHGNERTVFKKEDIAQWQNSFPDYKFKIFCLKGTTRTVVTLHSCKHHPIDSTKKPFVFIGLGWIDPDFRSRAAAKFFESMANEELKTEDDNLICWGITQSGLPPIWESFTYQTDGWEALLEVLQPKCSWWIDTSSEVQDKEYLQYMTGNIVNVVREPPLNCTAKECLIANSTGMGAYARHLFDVFYMYGMALSSLNSTDSKVYQNVSLLCSRFTTSFQGMTGKVVLNDNLSRMPIYQVYSLNSDYDQIAIINFNLDDKNQSTVLNYNNENSQVWHFWSGSRPLDTPICGFLGKSCPLPFFEQYRILVFVFIIVVFLLLLTITICVSSKIKNRRMEQKRINSEWQIPFIFKSNLLWTAPEVIREKLSSSKMESSADIYSFAIVASEILTKREAWDLHKRKESYEEIVHAIKKGGTDVLRPDLQIDIEVNTVLISLVKHCWCEKPRSRPSAENINKVLLDLTPSTKDNLMDHVFLMLEEYTSSLEVEVEERTRELTLEKKKSDILLWRMLPKQVAERLKAGHHVEPEEFDLVTVFFSDLVKFTDLSNKCSPFQVVNILNEIFSKFDSILEKHDVYKVESIGDGFLCVSGLPTRNKTEHIRQIANMSLCLMEFCSQFTIPHLPSESVKLRIGINSGPCVAGVVGLSMPRYCLFGDTVNTASRMESNGRPSMIHMTEAAHNLLIDQFPFQYDTHSRGEVIIKGKGVMTTYWLLGKLIMNTQSQLPATQVLHKPQRISSFSDSGLSDTPVRSVSPYVEKLHEYDDDEMKRVLRRELMTVEV